MKATLRKKLNKKITEFTSGVYFDSIPIEKLSKILESEGVTAINEDGTPLNVVFCGSDSECEIELALDGKAVLNSILRLSWYRMQSGRFEIVSYVS